MRSARSFKRSSTVGDENETTARRLGRLVRDEPQAAADEIARAVAHVGGRMTLAAKHLGVGRSTLHGWVKDLQEKGANLERAGVRRGGMPASAFTDLVRREPAKAHEQVRNLLISGKSAGEAASVLEVNESTFYSAIRRLAKSGFDVWDFPGSSRAGGHSERQNQSI